MADKIQFQTSDDVTIVGNYYNAGPGTPIVLMLHMMPATKESWDDLAIGLLGLEYSSLAIDLRGHGESTKQGEKTLDHIDFSDEEHRLLKLDIDGAIDFIKENHQVELSKVAVIGASIGANLVFNTLVKHDEIPTGIALSPGLDYKGVEPSEDLQKMSASQSVLLVASDDDGYSFDSIRQLKDVVMGEVEMIELRDAGHGTNMFLAEPELFERVIDWIRERLK